MPYHILVETDTILQKRLATNSSSSILISILYIIGLIDWSCCHSYAQQRHRRREVETSYVYSTTIILRCFIVRIWFRLDSNRALHNYLSIIDLPYNRKVMKACEYQYCHYYHVDVLLIED